MSFSRTSSTFKSSRDPKLFIKIPAKLPDIRSESKYHMRSSSRVIYINIIMCNNSNKFRMFLMIKYFKVHNLQVQYFIISLNSNFFKGRITDSPFNTSMINSARSTHIGEMNLNKRLITPADRLSINRTEYEKNEKNIKKVRIN